MPSVISNVLTTYRTKLAMAVNAGGAGLTNVDQNKEEHDPAGTRHQKFRLTLEGGFDDRDLYGGGVSEYEIPLRLRIYWDPETREDSVWNTAGDDLLEAVRVMRKASNRPTGCQLITPAGGSIQEVSTREIMADLRFTAIVRETQDLT